jgi:cellulose synthase/poly-beta-1,6-N-acetylglucosamine synthase-like glycosyltransferase
MMNILLWLGAVLWIFLFIQLIVNRALARDLSRIDLQPVKNLPFVSIVVPARNEERSIREAVSSFCTQDYPLFEVLVVDDRSTDATPQILAELRRRFSNLRVIDGRDPPEGWLGKPHALEIGRKEAKGQWLLFVDADVVYGPDLLNRAIAYVMREEADMLFLAPNFTTKSVTEAVLMSNIYFVAAAAFPAYLATHSKSNRFAGGGGVFNLVSRDALTACGAFESIKDAVVDDVALGYKVKAAGCRLAGAMAGSLIRIRMYHSASETVEGFTKNMYPLARQLPWILPIPFVGGFLLTLLPYYAFFDGLLAGFIPVPAAISLIFAHLVFGCISLFFKQPWYIAFLNPLREVGWWWIMVRSLVVYHRKGIVWRGRSYRDKI